jgi:hypothetical protein
MLFHYTLSAIILFLVTIIKAGHIYSWDPEILYKYNGSPE